MHLEASPRENSLPLNPFPISCFIFLSPHTYCPRPLPGGSALAWCQQRSFEKRQSPPVPSISHRLGQAAVVSSGWTELQSLVSLSVRALVLWHSWESCRRDRVPGMQAGAQV